MKKIYPLFLLCLFLGTTVFSQALQTPNAAAEVNSFSVPTITTPIIGKTPDYSSQGSKAMLYENGPLITHPTSGVGGAPFSLLEDPLTTWGFGYQINSGNMIGDDFTSNDNWILDSIVFFGYQTGSTLTSSFQTHHFMILNGHPDSSSTQIVFGDTTTNVLIDTYWSGIYRGSDTTSTDRPIMRNVCDASGCTLTPGTYYIIWRAQGSLTSGPWAPPIAILGTQNTGNAIQYISSGVTWDTLLSAEYPQGLPFEIYGSTTASVSEDNISPMSIYPNPTNGTLYISNAKSAQVNVYNIIGELVFSGVINSEEYILDLHNQKNGIYIIQTRKENLIKQEKIILQK
jgi:hypothetical protein